MAKANLTKAQRFLLGVIKDNHATGMWTEVMKAERRTAEALVRRNLIETRTRGDGSLEGRMKSMPVPRSEYGLGYMQGRR
jgi:hypothetical protein